MVAQPSWVCRRSSRSRASVLVVAFGLLLAAWVMGNPLVAAPDEPAQYVRALGSGYGQWTGDRYVAVNSSLSPRDQLLATLTRTFRIPARFALKGGHPGEPLGCVTWTSVSAACQLRPPTAQDLMAVQPLPGAWDRTPTITAPAAGGPQASYVGSYQPFLYLPLGLAARAAGSAEVGLRAARAAGAACCLLLLLGAVRCTGSRAQLFGLLLAVTPTAVFLAGTVTTNSFEILGSVCFLAAGLALVSGRRPTEVWVWAGVSGVTLAMAKATGPVWLLIDVSFLVALLGGRGTVALVKEHRSRVRRVAAVLVLAAAASAGWTVTEMGHQSTGLQAARPFLRPALHQLPALLDGTVGLFGWVDTPLPPPLYLLGRVLLGSALTVALVLGTGRQRVLLLAATATWAIATVAITAGVQNPAGAAGQARHTMAIAALIPMLCGYVITQRGSQLPRRYAVAGLALGYGGVAALQLGSWYSNAHRYAVGLSGRWDFLGSAAWSPPGHWWPWLLCAATGAVLLAVGGLIENRPRSPQPGAMR